MHLKSYLTVKDHTVSGEEFQLLYDSEADLLQTFPVPKADKLAAYYQSEDYISHTSSRRTVIERIYHLVRNHAVKRKVALISVSNSGKILDIGAGTGDFLEEAKSQGWDVTGIEPSPQARAIAESKGVSFAKDTSALPDNTFDVITMWHVLEHVPDFSAQLTELKRLLKPDGTIYIAVPNYKSYDAQYYGKFWAAFDVPRHLWHFSQKAVSIITQQHGLHVVKVKPMLFDSFYVSLLSEKYKTGSINYLKAFYIGLKSNIKARKTSEFSSLIYIIKNPT